MLVKSRIIPRSTILNSVYSHVDHDHNCYAGRLNSDDSWTPDPLRLNDEQKPTYLQVDLLSKSDSRKAGFQIHGIATQGTS